MASSPELFVVCKNCQSQVSPYITECPYCGQRLRKRAPKIERDKPTPAPKRRRVPSPSLGPLRTGEIPGIRGDETRRPTATIALVALGALWWLALIPLREEGIRFVVDPLGEWWQVLTAPFLHNNGWYQFAALGAVGIFGWMLERRHGWLAMLGVWLLAASGGMAAVKAIEGAPADGGPFGLTGPFALGASGGALGLLCAWAVPHVLARRRGEGDDDADLLAAAVIFVLLCLMPIARPEVSAIATAVGVLAGCVAGLFFARLSPR